MADNKQNTDNKNKIPNINRPGNNNNKKNKFNSYWIPGLIGLTIIFMFMLNTGNGAIETNWKDFKNEMLLQHDVQRLVVVNDKRVEIYIKPDKLNSPKFDKVLKKGFGGFAKAGPQYYFNINSVDIFEKRLDDAQKGFSEDEKIYAESETRKDVFGDLLSWLLPIIILVGIWLFIFRRMSGAAGGAGGAGNIFNVGKSKAQIFDKESNVKVDFKDVAGLEEAKIEIKEIVDFLKRPKKYTDLGGKIPKGALLVGPPGTGKTLLAKAVAGEAHVPFFSMSGSDFVEMFVGVGASRVRDLVQAGKRKSPLYSIY